MVDTLNQVVGKECKFVTYCPPYEPGGRDLHVIKEVTHNADGTLTPSIKLVENFKRPFWVTKTGARNHKQKKEWELIDNVIEYKTTQSRIIESAARALGEPWFKGDLRKLSRNPYLYGTDILSTAIIKKMYQQKYNNAFSNYRVAAFDTETDVVNGTEEIICATLTCGSKVFTVATKAWMSGITDLGNRVNAALNRHLSETVVRRKIEFEFLAVENELEIVLKIFEKAHEWKPDFFAIWNIMFDMGKIERCLAKNNVSIADVISDPAVPREFRYYRFKEGPKQTVTSSGVLKPLKWNQRWHTVYCPASFYFVDAGCVYTKIRTGAQEEPSYSLEAITAKHEVDGKLKIEDPSAPPKGTLEWHQYMQMNRKIDYVIYNIQDTIAMLDLDEKTKDLEVSMAVFSGHSDFENFKSQPRRGVDRLHYFCLEKGRVMGTTSDEMVSEDDEKTLDLKDWIITLPAHLVADNGLQIIAENHQIKSNIRTHVGDLDVSASYPNGGSVFNISKETTKRELISIDGIREEVHRMQGINLSGGLTNAAEFCQTMFGLPSFDILLDDFIKTKQLAGSIDPKILEVFNRD